MVLLDACTVIALGGSAIDLLLPGIGVPFGLHTSIRIILSINFGMVQCDFCMEEDLGRFEMTSLQFNRNEPSPRILYQQAQSHITSKQQDQAHLSHIII